MTNPILEERDMYDRYCNAVLERFLKYPNNAILVSSPILKDYINKNYPEAKVDWSIVSTTRPENINSNFNEKIKEYNRIVLPRKYVKDFNFLKTLNEEDRGRYELLCSDPCPVNCPRLATHYEEYARVGLFQTDNMDIRCTGLDKNDLFHLTYICDQITPKEINNYLELGYNRFKLSGRKNAHTVFYQLLKYTAKPEYQYELAFYFISRVKV